MVSWEVQLGDRRCAITTAVAPNGKLMVRANGKMATAPIGPEEQERELEIEGWRFRLARDGETWRLEELGEIEWPAFVDETPSIADEPVRRALWLTTIIVALIVAVLGIAANSLLRRSAERASLGVDSGVARSASRIVDAVRTAVRVEAAGALFLAAFVFFRAGRYAPALGWIFMTVVALTLLYADAMLHRHVGMVLSVPDAMVTVGRFHGAALVLLVVTAGLCGAARWVIESDSS